MVENAITTVGTITTATPTICSGQTPFPITGTAGAVKLGGALEYQWYRSTNGVSWTKINLNGTSQNYTPTSGIVVNTYYQRRTISSRGGGAIKCEESSNVQLVQISGGPIADLVAYPGAISETNTITVCLGETIEFVASGGVEYEFLVGGSTVRARSNVATYTDNTLITGNQVTVRSYNAEGCFVDSDPINIKTAPLPSTVLNSSLNDNITFCTNESVLFTAESDIPGTNFTFSINGVPKLGPSLTSTYTTNLLNNSDVVSVTYTTPDGCSVSKALIMVENAITSAGTISPTVKLTICSGDTPSKLTSISSPTASGDMSYKWYTSTDTLNWDEISSTNSASYQPGSLTQTSYFKRTVVSSLNFKECTADSNVVEIFVTAPITGLGGTVTNDNEVLCVGDVPTNLSIAGGAAGALITYQWQNKVGAGAWENIPGATSSNLVFSTGVSETTRYRRQSFAAGSASCVATSDEHLVTVNTINPGGLNPNLNATYCFGNTAPTLVSSPSAGAPGGVLDATGQGTITYQWQISENNADWTNIGGANLVSYSPPALITTTYYRRKAFSSLFDPTSGTTKVCENITNSIQLTILPELDNGNLLASQSVCSNELPNNIQLVGAASISTSITYQWQRSLDKTNWSTISGQSGAVLPFTAGSTWNPVSPRTYYRAQIVYTGAPNPVEVEKSSVILSEKVPAVAPSIGVTYTIAINSQDYTFTTTAASSTLDAIGLGLARLIDVSPIVNASYNSTTNIVAITPAAGSFNVARTTGTPPSIAVKADSQSSMLNMKILVSGLSSTAVKDPAVASCQTYSDILTIDVTPGPILNQTSNPPGNLAGPSYQIICPDSRINTITYQFGGAADFVVIERLSPSLVVTSTTGGTVTNIGGRIFVSGGSDFQISGDPTFASGSGNINNFSITTSSTFNTCDSITTSYTIEENWPVQAPQYISKNGGGFNSNFVVLGEGTKMYNNTMCNSSTTVTQTFSVCYGYASKPDANLEFEWTFSPVGAFAGVDFTPGPGSSREATYSLSPGFSGVATITVRAKGCDNLTGNDLNVPIHIVPYSIPIASQATMLDTPVAIERWDGCMYIGPEPECQITQEWIDDLIPGQRHGPTRYFASTLNTDTNDYSSVEYRIAAITPDASSTATFPGTIHPTTGIMTWQVGWVGSFRVQARALSCNGAPATLFNGGKLVEIKPQDNPITGIQFVGTELEPNCPIPATGHTSKLQATINPNTLFVDWFIDNPSALTPASYVATPVLDADGTFPLLANADKTLTLNWNPGFTGGVVTVYAETRDLADQDCPAPKFSRVMFIPTAPTAILTSPAGSDFQQVCQGSNISTITYEIRASRASFGFTQGVSSSFVTGDPQGTISVNETRTAQTSTYTLETNPAHSFDIGETYTIIINGVRSSFTTTNVNTDTLGQGLADAINNNVNLNSSLRSINTPAVTASYIAATDQLVIKENDSHKGYSFDTFATNVEAEPGMLFGAPVSSEAVRTISIAGQVSENATATTYDYLIIPSVGSGCVTTSFAGQITVNPSSNITYKTGSSSVTLCDNSDFNPNIATLRATGASGFNVSGLPTGLSTSVSGTGPIEITIKGKVNLGVAVRNVYPVEISTTGNPGGCSSDIEIVNIIVDPVPVISAVDAGFINQSKCVSESITPIEFEVNNINYNLSPDVGSVFPPGVTGELISRPQVTQFQIGGTDSAPADTFTININSLSSVVSTSIAGGVLNTDAIGLKLATDFSSAASPNFSFSFDAGTDIMSVTGPSGTPFLLSLSETSGTVSFTSPVVATTPGIYRISGTPSALTTQTTSFIYKLTTDGSSCNGASTVSGTITITPLVGGSHKSSSGPRNQTICDNTSITPIQFDITPGAVSLISNASNPSWLNLVLSDDKLTVTVSTVDALKNVGVDYQTSFPYSFTLVGGPCGADPTELGGVITLTPNQRMVVRDASTLTQSVCEGDPIIPIIYDLYGSANSATFTPSLTLPANVEGIPTKRKQVMNINLTGPPTGNASETYEVFINGIKQSFVTTTSTKTLVQIGNGLANAINSNPDVTASFTAGASNTIVITAVVAGASFGTTVLSSSNAITLSQPILRTTPGVYTISGIPTDVSTSTVYSFIVETSGTSCAIDSSTGTLTVNPNSEITRTSVATSTNQVVCDETSISTITYQLKGGGVGYNITGLPNGIQHSINNTVNPPVISIYGAPETNDTHERIYSYEISTFANSNGCGEVSETGTITVRPLEKLVKSSSSGSEVQTVCEDSELAPIIYEMYGGATAVTSVGLPSGISLSTVTPTQQITRITLGGTNTGGVSTETFRVFINGNEFKYETKEVKTPAQVATELSTLLDASALISSSIGGTVITITSASSGTGFSVGSSLSSNTNVTISDPTTTQGTGKVAIFGEPKFSSVATGTQEVYNYSITTNGVLCDSTSVSGTITVTPKSIITAVSTPTLNQTVCDDVDISPIGFNYSGSAQGASISWNPSLPNGINFTFNNITKTATITGKPDNLNLLTQTDYTYTVTTIGNLSGCSEASITGTITVNPNDVITYDPTSGSRNQTLCSGAEITPIRYQLSGGATGATVVGLLDGLGYTVTASNVLVISGKVSPVNAAINNQSFTISTIGSCSPDLTEVTGDFSVYPVSQLSLTSGNPIQTSGVCNDGIEDITPIIYTWGGGAQTVTVTWSPFDPQFDQQSFGVPLKTFQIAGATTAAVSVTTIFSYEINTVNANGCSEATTLTGQIEVNPKPVINKVAVESLIKNETCYGSTDGSIILPSTSSIDFNNYVSGGQIAVKQIDHITFAGTLTLADSVNITLGTKSYAESVTNTTTFTQIINDLIFKINNSPAPNDSPVTASLIGTNTLRLEAKVAGTPFTPVISITSSDVLNSTILTVQNNKVTNYSIAWTKTGTTDVVNPSALTSGTYDLKVTLNGCESNTESFTITGPSEMKINDLNLCGGATTGAIQGSVSGGDGVYNIFLYDENGALVDTHPNTGSATFTFTNLAVIGKSYRILFRDNTCTDPTKWAERDNITLGTEISYDPSKAVITRSYCATSTASNGSIKTLNIVAGSPVSAFSGGTGNYSYAWYKDGILRGNSPNLENLEVGNYSLTVSDTILNCSISQEFTVGGYDQLKLNILASSGPNFEATTGTGTTTDAIILLNCETGFDNGVINVEATGGVGNTYTFTWTKLPGLIGPSASAVGNLSSAENLSAGLYRITVKDQGPDGLFCEVSKTVLIKQPSSPSVSFDSVNSSFPSCPNDQLVLKFVVNNTQPGFDYDIKLNGGEAIGEFTGSGGTSGTLTVTYPYADLSSLAQPITTMRIIDGNGCETSDFATNITWNIPTKPEVTASPSDTDCESGVLGSIEFTSVNDLPLNTRVQIKNVSKNYSFDGAWGDLTGSDLKVRSITNLDKSGEYQWTISLSASECLTSSGNVDLADKNPSLTYKINKKQDIGCGNEFGVIEISDVENLISPLSIVWEQEKTIQVINSNPRGEDYDGDGYLDIDENLQSTDPYSSSATQTALLLSKDTDGDGLTDEFENTFSQTNINLVDTDGDGVDDKFDGYPLDPLRKDLIESKQVWTELPGLKSNLIASGLEVGVYRAKVSDARNYTNPLCGGINVTESITVKKKGIRIINFRTQKTKSDCNDPAQEEYDILFNIENNLGNNTSFELTLSGPNGSPDLSGATTSIYVKPGSPTSLHRIKGQFPGDYILSVSEAGTSTCVESLDFTIQENLKLEYAGSLTFDPDPCTGLVDELKAEISGGVPFIIEGVATYDYEWTYTASGSLSPDAIYVGEVISNAKPGSYQLTVTDSQGCQITIGDSTGTNPNPIIVNSDSTKNFVVDGGLTDNDGKTVKSLPPDCDAVTANGKIKIEVTGGQLPYQINWYIEDLSTVSVASSGSTSTPAGYKYLDSYKNQTSLSDLIPGNYKVIIKSLNSNSSCGNLINNSLYYEENIIVEENRELYVMEGPYLSSNLCNNDQGDITIKIFDNNNGRLNFTYDGSNIGTYDPTAVNTSTNPNITKIDAFTYNIKITNASENSSKIMTITNIDNNCRTSVVIDKRLGEAGFTYATTQSVTSSSNPTPDTEIKVRDEVTFQNTSTDPYVRSEWIFGDGSLPVNVDSLTSTITTVRHIYGISGTYFATLRIYNSVGCYDEFTQEIIVGKGYNILVPNAFTPTNDDKVNDIFRPHFTGFKTMNFSVYDYRGNLVYFESDTDSTINDADAPCDNKTKPIEICGWDGTYKGEEHYSPYYIYTAVGEVSTTDPTKNKEIVKSGTFIMIR